MPRTLLAVFAIAAIAAVAGLHSAGAQEKKARPDRAAEASERKAKSGSGNAGFGLPSCNGLLWVGSSCQHPNGRTCQVREGSSGNAVLDCHGG